MSKKYDPNPGLPLSVNPNANAVLTIYKTLVEVAALNHFFARKLFTHVNKQQLIKIITV